MVHLDTDIVIEVLRGNEAVARRMSAAVPDVAISSIVLAELVFGAAAASNPIEARRRLDWFLPSLAIVSFDAAAAEAYARIRLSLRRKGRPIGEVDTLIAAVAVGNSATLVTHNTKHFEQVDGLVVEDWVG